MYTIYIGKIKPEIISKTSIFQHLYCNLLCILRCYLTLSKLKYIVNISIQQHGQEDMNQWVNLRLNRCHN